MGTRERALGRARGKGFELTSARGVLSDTNYNSRYFVLVRLLVMNHVCNVFEVEITLTC